MRSLRWAGADAETLCCAHVRSVVEITRQTSLLRSKDKGKTSVERVTYLCTLEPDESRGVELLGRMRRYWDIEGGLHQRLDVSGGEDASRARNRNAILVLGILRLCAIGFYLDWRRTRKNLRQSTFKDFHDAMNRFNHRLAFATITSQSYAWPPASGIFLLGNGVAGRSPQPVIRALWSAIRPKTLPAAAVPVWAGCVLEWRLGGSFMGLLAVCTLAGALCIQIATNLFNDAIDAAKGADTGRRLGPTRVTAGGLLPRRAVLGWAWLCLAGAVACGVVLFRARGWPIVALGVPSLYLAYGYTGGPLPLAYRGLGELFVILFFGLVAVAGTVFIQGGGWRPEAILLGAQVGLLSAVLISINNLRDRNEDATTGKRTLAVRLGPRGARLLVWAEIKLAALLGIAWFAFGLPVLGLATLPVWSLGTRIGWVVLTRADGRELNRWLALAGVQLLLFAAAFHFIAWLAPQIG